MARTSTRVFVLEVMGRHAGWIAAAGGLAGEGPGEPPHIILFPEIPFDETAFLARVKESVDKYEYCVVVVSEGAHYADGRFLAEAGGKDAFGHAQLGGVAATVAQLVKAKLNLKYHYAIADYLQRAARHIASKVDVEQAYAMGKAAVELALKGENAVMPTIVRKSDKPYRWTVGKVRIGRGRQQREKDAAGLHYRRRLRHHGRLPALPGAADQRRGLPALQGRPAHLCQPQESAGCEKAAKPVCDKVAPASPGGGEAPREKQGTNPTRLAPTPLLRRRASLGFSQGPSGRVSARPRRKFVRETNG